MSRLTLLYASLLATTMYAADVGRLPDVLQQVHDLPAVDKVIHFGMFGLLALMVNVSLVRSRRWAYFGAILTGSILVAVVATLDEASNLWVAHRSWSLGDLAANYLGVLCVGVLPLVWWSVSRRSPVAAPEVGDAAPATTV